MSITSRLTTIAAAGNSAGGSQFIQILSGLTESVAAKANSLTKDSNGNFLVGATSSEPTIFDYQGSSFVSLSSEPGVGINFQKNLDTAGSNDECNFILYDGSSNVYTFNYGFYYANNLNQNRIWVVKQSVSNGSISDWWNLTYTSYYLGTVVAAHYVSSTQIFLVINDYVSHGSSGGNIMFGEFNPTSNTFTNVRYFGGSNNNGTRATGAFYKDGYWYVTGQSAEVQASTADVGFVSKFTAAGVFQWWRTYGTSTQNNYGGYVYVDASDNVYSSYRFRDTGDGRWEVVFQKHNSSGTKQWEQSLNFNSDAYGCYVDSSGRLFVSGNVNDGLNRFFMMELNPSTGALIWANRLVPGSSPTGTWNSGQPTNLSGGMITENDDGSLNALCRLSNSTFFYSSEPSIMQGLSKDGDNIDFGTELSWSTWSVSLTGKTSTTFSTSSLTTGTTTGSVSHQTSTPTNISTNTSEYSYIEVP